MKPKSKQGHAATIGASLIAAVVHASFLFAEDAIAVGEDPPGCNANMIGASLTPFVNNAPVPFGERVLEGQLVTFRVLLFIPPPVPPVVFCNCGGGQLSVTFPDGTLVPMAGYGGSTPPLPVIADGVSFEIDAPVRYVANPLDAINGVAIARTDYGSTANLPNQANGMFQTVPPLPANATAPVSLLIAPDCNRNGVADDEDLKSGTSLDRNGNDIPDECEDCNNNGIFDPIEIAAGLLEDYNLDTLADLCDEGFDGIARWVNQAGGLFRLHTNWDRDTPLEPNGAAFDQVANYDVSFDMDATCHNLAVTAGEVQFNLNGHELVLNSVTQAGVHIDGVSATPTLLVNDGGLVCEQAEVGASAGRHGRVEVAGQSGSWFVEESLCIGCEGTGSMLVGSDSLVVSRDATVGEEPGSIGNVTVQSGGEWQAPFFLSINRGNVHLEPESLLVSQFGGILVLNEGSLTGSGSVIGNVYNFGVVAPGESAGELSVQGNYSQLGQLPGLGTTSGALEIELAGTMPGVGHDRLDVSGSATLGGGLFVTLDQGYNPQLNDSFTVLASTGITGAFDVALMPGLTDNRFLRVQYAGNAAGPGGEVTLKVQDLTAFLAYGQGNATIPGTPTALAVGDLNNDGFDDLAVTVSNGLGLEGAVLIFLNDESSPGQFFNPIQITVDVKPIALEIARLDGNDSPDLAVIHDLDGISPGNLIVLANTNNGSQFTQIGAPIPVGVHPRDVAASKLDAPPNGQNVGDLDLVVVNQGSGTVMVFRNDGSGQFPPAPSQTMLVCLATSVDPADVDNDRDIDLPVVGCDAVQQLLNCGSCPGGFQPGELLPVGDGAHQVIALDLNRDSQHLVELVTINADLPSLSVLVNDANDPGAFTPAVTLPIDLAPRAIIAANLDGHVATVPGTEPPLPDPDLDLAVLAGTGDDARIIVLRNDTDALVPGAPVVFATDPTSPVSPSAIAMAKGENVDGQPGPDLITITNASSDSAIGGSNDVHLHFNHSGPSQHCLGDIMPSPAGDGVVNVDDLLALINSWGTCPTSRCAGDVVPPQGDGQVNVDDLLAVINAWGACPGR